MKAKLRFSAVLRKNLSFKRIRLIRVCHATCKFTPTVAHSPITQPVAHCWQISDIHASTAICFWRPRHNVRNLPITGRRYAISWVDKKIS